MSYWSCLKSRFLIFPCTRSMKIERKRSEALMFWFGLFVKAVGVSCQIAYPRTNLAFPLRRLRNKLILPPLSLIQYSIKNVTANFLSHNPAKNNQVSFKNFRLYITPEKGAKDCFGSPAGRCDRRGFLFLPRRGASPPLRSAGGEISSRIMFKGV